MDQLSDIKHKLETERPSNWDVIPDIGLYKDQVLSYMERQKILCKSSDKLTGAMINNYIKMGLLPRTVDKKYSREHLALLTIICALKQVLSVNDCDILIKSQTESLGCEEFYNKYSGILDAVLKQTASFFKQEINQEDLSSSALSLALSCYVMKFACENILDIIQEGNTDNVGDTEK